jgi:hypothetical protein
MEGPWVGKGHAMGMARLGWKELGHVVVAFPSAPQAMEEAGTAGNPTQLEVNVEKGNEGAYQEYLRSRAQEASAKQREPPDAAMER